MSLKKYVKITYYYKNVHKLAICKEPSKVPKTSQYAYK